MANNAFSGGSGTELDPFLVRNADDLLSIETNLNAYYLQISDIDLSGIRWMPIGYSDGFYGSYDGGEFVISNLTIADANNYSGLFSYVSGAVIRNMIIKNAAISLSGYSSIGILLGGSDNSTIENCNVLGTIMGDNGFYIGGLIGESYSDIITDCAVAGDINIHSGNAGYVAGFVGSATSKIERCSSSINVTCGHDMDYYNNYIAGFIGYYSPSSSNGAIIKDCYTTGNVIGMDAVGGFAGYTNNVAAITNCYAANRVSFLEGQWFGGKAFIGDGSPSIINSYFNNELCNLSDSRAAGLNSEQMRLRSNFIDWDFNSVWTNTEGVNFPHFPRRKRVKCKSIPLTKLIVN